MRITVSKLAYNTKSIALRCQSEHWKKLDKDGLVPSVYTEVNATPQQLCAALVNGYTVHTGLYIDKVKSLLRNDGTIFRDNHFEKPFDDSGYLKRAYESYEFWCGSQFMFIDVDCTKASSIEEYVSKLKYRPTFGFYTPSDKPGDRRFKLVYCFDCIMTDPVFWAGLSYYLHREAEKDTGEELKDKCGRTRTQPTYGNQSAIPPVYDGIVYSPRDFNFIKFDQDVLDYVNEKFAKKQSININPFYTWAIGKAKNYNDLCSIVHPTKLPYRTEDDSNVFWVKDYTVNSGYEWGLTKESYWELFTPSGMKISDGHRRRIKLYKRTCLRRILDPTLKPEEALICLYWDREKIIDNSDGVVNNNQLVKCVEKAFLLSQNELEEETKNEIDFLRQQDRTPQIIYRAKPEIVWSKDNRKDKSQFTPLKRDSDHPYQLGKIIWPKPMTSKDTMRKCFLMHIIDICFDKTISDSDNIIRINDIMAKNKFRLRVNSRQTISNYKKSYKVKKEKTKTRDEFIISEYLNGKSSYQIKDELDFHPEYAPLSDRQIRRIIKKYEDNKPNIPPSPFTISPFFKNIN